MRNNHQNFDNNIDLKKIFRTINIIPVNWKKFGEVYCNELEQPIFICLVCLEKTDSIKTAFNTNDGSAFWWHIQQQHINEECETIDQISEEIRNFESNYDELEALNNNEENSKTDEHLIVDQSKEQQLNALEIFHENLVRNNDLNDSNSEIELEDKTNIDQNGSTQITDKEDIKLEIKQEDNKNFVNKFLNCNYYYDNETYTISDDEDDYDESDEEDEKEISAQSEIINESKIINYLKHNDTIEISDDEMDTDDQDKVNTRPNTNSFCANYEDNNFGNKNKNSLDLFHRMMSQNIEDNNVLQDVALNIPRPDTSPLISNNFNNFDYNSERGYECTQSLIPAPKKRATSFRAYQCKICGSRTINEQNMLIHQYRLHNITTLEAQKQYHQIEQSYQNQEQRSVKNSNSGKPCRKPFRCKSCKTRTTTEDAMERHQKLYHSTESDSISKPCELCHKRIFNDKLQRHMLLHTLKGFKCIYCGVVYKHKSYLNSHVNKYHSHEISTQIYPQQMETNASTDPIKSEEKQ